MIIELSEASGSEHDVSLTIPRDVVMGGVALDDVYEAAHDLANGLLDLGVPPQRSPWRLAGPIDPVTLDRASVSAALDRLRRADSAITNPSLRSGVSFADTQEQFAAIAAWLDTAHSDTARTTAKARTLVTAAWNAHADSTRDTVDEFRLQNADKLGDFLPAVLATDLDALIR